MTAQGAMVAACLTALLSGCSLVVDELHLECDEPSDCDALNAQHGLDRTQDCAIYQCRSDGRGCEKRAQDLDGDGYTPLVCHDQPDEDVDCDDSFESGKLRAPKLVEACNGYDDDCDGVIDEGTFGEAPADALIEPLFIGDGRVVHVSRTGAAGASYLAVTRQEDRTLATSVWRYDSTDLTIPFDDAEVARSDDEDGNCANVQCAFVELVIATAPDVLLALGVNRSGCAAGEMRVGGAGSVPMPDKHDIHWSATLSDCRNGAAASRASLGLLPPTNSNRQGLALWRAGEAQQTRAPLAGNGLWIESRGKAPPIIHSTDEQIAPQIAGSEGQDPAAIAAWRGRGRAGYFVAYDTAEAVEIAFVPQLAGPTAHALRDWLRADALEEPSPRALALTLDEAADPQLTQPRGLAAAWRTARGDVRFARISFDDEQTPALRVEEPVTLQAGSDIIDGPEIIYLPQGLVDTVSKPEASAGGWFVTWLERSGAGPRLVGVRVPEMSAAQDGPFALYQGQHPLGNLFAYRANDATPGYGFADTEASERQLYIGSLECPDTD